MSDRRPIASRNSKLAERIAKSLANRDISPNLISQFSMVFAALAGGGILAVWHDQRTFVCGLPRRRSNRMSVPTAMQSIRRHGRG